MVARRKTPSSQKIAPPQASGQLSASILREAAGIVEGPRNTTHGDKERSFLQIAKLWQTYLEGQGVAFPAPLAPEDVAWLMVLLKMGRFQSGTPIRDHFVDAAGYAGLAGELALDKELSQ